MQWYKTKIGIYFKPSILHANQRDDFISEAQLAVISIWEHFWPRIHHDESLTRMLHDSVRDKIKATSEDGEEQERMYEQCAVVKNVVSAMVIELNKWLGIVHYHFDCHSKRIS